MEKFNELSEEDKQLFTSLADKEKPQQPTEQAEPAPQTSENQ